MSGIQQILLGGGFSPAILFASGAQGAWYDPSDFSTLFQNSTGTTPVTAVEQPVRLMLDRSRGLVLGPELVTNGGFDADLTGWTLSGTTLPTWSAAGIVLFSDGNFFSRARQTFTTVSGRTYALTFNVVTAAGSLQVDIGTTAGGSNVLASGSLSTAGARSFVFVAQGTTTHIELENGSVASPVIDNVSVRELPGNHALAPNDASRPVLRSRYNLLTRSEEFDNAGWTKVQSTVTANAAVAPNGTTTADKLVENNMAVGGSGFYLTHPSTTVAASYTYTVYAKPDGRNWLGLLLFDSGNVARTAWFDVQNGVVGTVGTGLTASIEADQNGFFRCRATIATALAGTATVRLYLGSADATFNYTGNGTSGILLWGAQLLTAADQTSTGGAYQRIAAATVYDVSNPVFRPYLAFDGSDDSLSTSAIDFSGTDEMTVFAGVTKLSDATAAAFAELTATPNTSNGTFTMLAPPGNGLAEYGFYTKGDGTQRGVFLSSNPAPSTAVLTGISDISTPVVTLRVNATQTGTNTSSQGAGAFANAALFIGRRNNTNFPFNGRIYSLAVLGRTATAAELSAMEAWVAGKTGVTI